MNFMGKEGFVWWVGVVEDRNDPLYLGRCKVRILGWHTENKNLMPTSELPWCYPIQPITSAAQTQVGSSPTGVVEGTWVVGFYRDGEDAQEPMMFGTLGGIPQEPGNPFEGFSDPRDFPVFDPIDIEEGGGIKLREIDRSNWPRDPDYDNSIYRKNGAGATIVNRTDTSTFPDTRFLSEPTTNRLSRGVKDTTAKTIDDPNGEYLSGTIIGLKKRILDKNVVKAKGGKNQDDIYFSEPLTQYAALYPYNHVHQSESGHIIEIDDTPRAERLHWFHRSGSFREMHPDGTIVDKCVLDLYVSAMRNSYEYVYNTKFSTIDRGYELFVNAKGGLDDDYSIKIGNNGNYNLNLLSGNITMSAPNRIATIQSGNLMFSAADSATISVRNTLNLNVGSIAFNTRVNTAFESDGTMTVSGGQVVMGAENNLAMISRSENHNISSYISENIQLPTPDPTILPANGYSRSINVGIGKIKLESADGAVTGGIDLNVGADGAVSQIKMANLGKIEISNAANSKFTFTELGQIQLSTEQKSAITLNTVGGLDIETATGDIQTNSTNGKITLQSGTGDIIATTTSGKMELKAESGDISIESLTSMVLESLKINLGKNADEQVIKGNSFLQNFLAHQHATGTGPSGPVLNGSPYVNNLSKKIFLE